MTGDVVFRFNYPRGSAEVPTIFGRKAAQRTLRGGDCVLLQQFSEELHWWNLLLCGPEKILYVWEPIGGRELTSRHPIERAFEKAVAHAGVGGWRIETIRLSVQNDSHQCGMWSHWFVSR